MNVAHEFFLSNITCKSTAHKLTRAFSLKTRNILLYFFEDFVRAANGAKLHFWIERNITLYACSRISKNIHDSMLRITSIAQKKNVSNTSKINC